MSGITGRPPAASTNLSAVSTSSGRPSEKLTRSSLCPVKRPVPS